MSEWASIGERLRYARRGAGYSLRAASAELGVSRTALWKWERGEVPLDAERLSRLADLYRVPQAYFYRTHRFTLRAVTRSHHQSTFGRRK